MSHNPSDCWPRRFLHRFPTVPMRVFSRLPFSFQSGSPSQETTAPSCYWSPPAAVVEVDVVVELPSSPPANPRMTAVRTAAAPAAPELIPVFRKASVELELLGLRQVTLIWPFGRYSAEIGVPAPQATRAFAAFRAGGNAWL